MFKEISNLWLNSAEVFDPVQHLFNGNFWQVTAQKFKPLLRGRILDLACGTGELADHIDPQSYLGIDMNERYIHFAKDHRRQSNYLVADITKLPVKDRFDTAVIISATHHLSDIQIDDLCQKLKKLKLTNVLIIDGLPKKPFVGVLEFLDAKLGGGDYFRDENELAQVIGPHFKITAKGHYEAKNSFYSYPYVVATAINP